MTELPLRLRWFLQWSQAKKMWSCVACDSYAPGINLGRQKIKSKKGKELWYWETVHNHDYDTLHHCSAEHGGKNCLVHKPDCDFLAAIQAQEVTL